MQICHAERSPKYLRLADKYEQLICNGRLPADSFLPSQAVMIRDERLSLGTVRQAIKELARRGLVCPEHGRGVRVLPMPPPDRQATRRFLRIGIAVLDPEADASVYLDVTKGVSDEITPLGGGVILYRLNGQSPGNNDLAHFFRESDGVVLMGTLKHRDIMLAYDSRKPCVIAGHTVELRDELICSAVTLDVDAAAGLVVQSLSGFGHRRIALCVDDVVTTYQQGLMNAFEAQCARLSMECRMMIAARLSNGVSSVLDAIGGDDPPSAVIVDHFGVGRWLCETITQRGLRVPDDISVVAVGNRDDALTGDSPVAGAAFDLEELGRLSARALAPDRGLLHIALSPVFMPGRTVGPARPVKRLERYHDPLATQALLS